MSDEMTTIQEQSSAGITGQLDYEEMMKAGMHFGRKRTVFNPGMTEFVFTMKNGICIIDLLKTRAEIEKAGLIIKEALASSKLILFVGLTKQSADGMKDLATSLNMPYVVNRWLGGCLTNFKIISARVKMLEDMEKKLQTGELDKYTKKERLMFERNLIKMKNNFEGLRRLTRIPDFVFVSSLKESALPVKESQMVGAKIIAISNTDSNPRNIYCSIPANDRSKKSVDMILNSIKDAVK